MLKEPSDPVVAVRVAPLAELTAVTVTFGITAPEESVTVPVSAPVEAVCAIRDGADSTRTATTTKHANFKIFLYNSHPHPLSRNEKLCRAVYCNVGLITTKNSPNSKNRTPDERLLINRSRT